MNRLQTNLSLIVVTLMGAGFGWKWLQDSRPPGAERSVAPVSALRVSTRELDPRTVDIEVEAFGALEPSRSARLAVEVGGRVVEVLEPWLPGTEVAEGQVLLRLDTGLLDQEVGVAEAAVLEAESALAAGMVEVRGAASAVVLSEESLEIALAEEGRAGALFAAGDAAASELDRARAARLVAAKAADLANTSEARAKAGRDSAAAALVRAKASASLTRERRARGVLRAPFAGHLVDRGPAIGSYLVPGELLGELHDLEQLELRLAVPEESLLGLKEGVGASVRLSAEPGRVREGVVRSVGVQADQATRSVSVVVSLKGGSRDAGEEQGVPLSAGQYAGAVLHVGSVERAVVVGRGEFTWEDGQAVAHVLEGAPGEVPVAKQRVLELGSKVDGGWLVEQGVRAGEVLITGPHGLLRDGAPCRLSESIKEAP
ncbi:MAG: efflux RND transporter periplasmic adaptor subunit [Planctomycetota bacterium]|nr:efflux RND transporter periplasmic adaptor subunit [Planctomycetota bacterium]